MSFATITQAANDAALQQRVTGCVAVEIGGNPVNSTAEMIWLVAAANDVQAAYASALAADNPNPGGDEAVITDQMILSAVQAHLPAP